MLRRLLPLLLALLAVGVFAAAGCGGDDDDDDGETTAVETTTTEETTTDETTEEDSVDTGDEDVDAAVSDAVEQCKQIAQSAPGLSSEAKSDVEDLCDEAGSGDIDDAQQAAEEVCQVIVEDTVPEGAAQDQALDACEAAATGAAP